MYFYRKLFACIISVLWLPAFSQTIRGKVVDETDGTALAFVTVYIPESPHYAETDSTGNFILHIPDTEEFPVRFNRLGYESVTLILKRQSLHSGFTLIQKLKKRIGPEVEISSGKLGQESSIQERVKSFEKLPLVSGNLESILPSIALGVRSSAGGELSSQYSVRGGSYDENLVFVNDFEVFRPQLIRNGQQEGLSFPNPDLIRELKFYSGGFEARFGDKLSSVLDIRYKVPDSLRGSLTLSALGGSAHIEGSSSVSGSGKSSKKWRYLLGARYKTTRYLLGSLDVEGEYQPDFLDIQSYMSLDLRKNLVLSWIGNINSSHFKLVPESSSVAKGSFFQIVNLNTAFEGSETDAFDQRMTGINLNYFSDKSRYPYFIKYSSTLYNGYEAEQFDILGYYRLVEVENGNTDEKGKEVKLWGEGTQHLYTRNYLRSWTHHHELRSGVEIHSEENAFVHFIQWGGFFRQEFFKDKINEWERLDSAGFALPYSEDGLELNEVYKSQNDFHNEKYALWLQDEILWRADKDFLMKCTPGIRMHKSVLNQEFLYNPRIKLEWISIQRKDHLQLWVSGGRYDQPPLYREMRTRDGSLNYALKSQKSMQYVIGLQKDFYMHKISPSRFRWISELYYKSLWDLVPYDLDNVRIRYSGNNEAKGYAVGWDNRIYGEFVPGAESWVNISFLRTREQIDGIVHREQNPQYPDGKIVKDVPRPTDQLFALGLFFQDYLPKNDKFKMHLNIQVASGLPYGLKGANVVFRNDQNLKAYHRVDIGFSYQLWDQFAKKRPSISFFKFCRQAWISAEIYNLLKVKNEASISWIKTLYNYQFAIPNYLTGQRFNLRLKVEF